MSKRFLFSIIVAFLYLSCSVFAFSSSLDHGASYIIQEGDTIQSLSETYGIPEDFLRSYNNIDESVDINNQTVINRQGDTLSQLIIFPLFDTIENKSIIAQQGDIIQGVTKEVTLNVVSDFSTSSLSTSLLSDYQISGLLFDKHIYPSLMYTLDHTGGASLINNSFLSLDAFEDIHDEIGTIQATWYQIGKGAARFAKGYCTDYAASRRPDLFILRDGKYRLFGGDAKDRYSTAKKAGLSVGQLPKKGAIAVFYGRGVSRLYGHVAIVEKISFDGKMVVTDMNYKGRNIVTQRVVDISEPIGYIYGL